MRIKELREDRDLTQSEVAQIIGCKQNTYAQYESGKRQIPTEVVKKLCIYYKVSADYILGLPDNLSYPGR